MTGCTVDLVIQTGISPARADTTADTQDRTTVHIHVHHGLQDNVGMAGMEDGVNRYYGCQNSIVQKFTDTTVDVNFF